MKGSDAGILNLTPNYREVNRYFRFQLDRAMKTMVA